MGNVLKRYVGYLMADHPTIEESHSVSYQHLRAVWTGENRVPRAGEWYLSGAIIEGYKAKSDLTVAYPIARLVRSEMKETLWEL